MQSKSKKIIIASCAVALVVIFSVIILLPNPLRIKDTSPTTVSSDSKTVYFTIIESNSGPMEGMNGSAYHLTQPWPLIEVNKGDTVIIHLISENSVEVHGFTIVHYFYPGVGLLPGASYTVKFVANEQGTFIITCLLFCTIHPLMDHGEFIVEP